MNKFAHTQIFHDGTTELLGELCIWERDVTDSDRKAMTYEGYTPVPTAPEQLQHPAQSQIDPDVNPEKNHGYFFDHANGIYFTYTKREMKVSTIQTWGFSLMIKL